MTFIWPALLWSLLLLPAALGLLLLARRRRQVKTRRFADDHLFAAVSEPAPAAGAKLTTTLQLAALAALLLAAARPVASPPWPGNRATVVIALDASRSMLADDLSPTRLESARVLAQSFIEQAPASTQIGLVSFSDSAAPLVLPTTDRGKLLAALAEVRPASNTSLAAAIVSGVRAMPGRQEAEIPEALTPAAVPPAPAAASGTAPVALDRQQWPPASLLILSDGVDNVGLAGDLSREERLAVAARFAADHEVKIYTVPVGTEGGAVSVIDGQPYFVPFEPEPLQGLARLSDGRSLDPEDESARAELFRELGTQIRWLPTEMEVSFLLAAFAVLLMVGAGALSMSWQRRVP